MSDNEVNKIDLNSLLSKVGYIDSEGNLIEEHYEEARLLAENNDLESDFVSKYAKDEENISNSENQVNDNSGNVSEKAKENSSSNNKTALLDFLSNGGYLDSQGKIIREHFETAKLAAQNAGFEIEFADYYKNVEADIDEKRERSSNNENKNEESNVTEKTVNPTERKLADNMNVELFDYLIANDLINYDGEINYDAVDARISELEDKNLLDEYKRVKEFGLEKYLVNQEEKENSGVLYDRLYEYANSKEELLDTDDLKLTNDEFEAYINNLLDENGSSKLFDDVLKINPHLPEGFNEEKVGADEEVKDEDFEPSAEEVKEEINAPISYKELHELILDDAKNQALQDIPFIVKNDDSVNDAAQKVVEATKKHYDANKLQVYATAMFYDVCEKDLEKKYKDLEPEKRPSLEEISKEVMGRISDASSEEIGKYFELVSEKLSEGKENELTVRPTEQVVSHVLAQNKVRREKVNKLKGIITPKRLGERLKSFDEKLTKRFGKSYTVAKTIAEVGSGIGCASLGGIPALGYGAYRIYKARKGLIKKYREEKEKGKTNKSCLKWAFTLSKEGGWKETLNVAGSGISFLGGPITAAITRSPKMLSSLNGARKQIVEKIKSIEKPINRKKAAIILAATVGTIALIASGDNVSEAIADVSKVITETEAYHTMSDTLSNTSNAVMENETFVAVKDTLKNIHEQGQGLRDNIRFMSGVEGQTVSSISELLDKDKLNTSSYNPSVFNEVNDSQYPRDDVHSYDRHGNHLSIADDNATEKSSKGISSLQHNEGDEINKVQQSENDVKDHNVDEIKKVELSERSSNAADKFIGKELSDKLEARFDNGELAKYTGGYTKDEFFHKSAMIRAYSPVGDKEFGNVLAKLSEGKEISADEAKYMSYLLSKVDDEGNLFCDYKKLLGKGPEAQKIYNDISNNPEKFGKNFDGFDRHKIVAKLQDIKTNDPEKFNKFVDSYKDVENVETLDANLADYNDKAYCRFEEKMFENQNPENSPIKVEKILNPDTGKYEEAASFDYSKLSPEAKLAYDNEFKTRVAELGLKEVATSEVMMRTQLMQVRLQMDEEAMMVFGYDNSDAHMKAYGAENLAKNVKDAAKDGVITEVKNTLTEEKPAGTKITKEIDKKGVSGKASEQKFTKTTQNDDGSITKEELIRKTSSGEITYADLDNASKDHVKKMGELGALSREGEAYSPIGKKLATTMANADILSGDSNYADDIAEYCKRYNIKINLDGQAYGQYEIPNKGYLNYVNPQHLSDVDKSAFDEIAKDYTDKNGKVDMSKAKDEFINRKLNGDIESEKIVEKPVASQELATEEKPKKKGFFKRLFGGKNKDDVVIPKAEVNATGEVVKPAVNPEFNSDNKNLDDKKVELKNRIENLEQKKVELSHNVQDEGSNVDNSQNIVSKEDMKQEIFCDVDTENTVLYEKYANASLQSLYNRGIHVTDDDYSHIGKMSSLGIVSRGIPNMSSYADIAFAHNGHDINYDEKLSEYCEKNNIKVNLDKQGYGQYVVPGKGVYNHVDMNSLNDKDLEEYNTISEKFVDGKGNIDFKGLNREFINQKLNNEVRGVTKVTPKNQNMSVGFNITGRGR